MSVPPSRSPFRADVEGLRALAVLPILLFHIDPQLCPGGFVGVDIFFVISGYLITGQIVGQGEAFSFRAFYWRRARRLGPALVATIVLALIAGWSLLSPRDYAGLAWSSLASLAAAANIYFYATANYFDASSLAKPLLHVWSLSLEEQFYLIWPAMLMLATRRFRSIGATKLLIAAALASFAASVLIVERDASMGFYGTPFRIFEFALGGLVAVRRPKLSPSWSNGVSATGLGLMFVSFAIFNGATPWPAANALLPSAGAALLIAGGGAANRMIANPVFRLVGRASYSIYLVHWPLIAFYAYWLVTPLRGIDQLGLFAASIIGGALLYRLIEQPFRLRDAREFQPQGDRAARLRWWAMRAVAAAPIVAAGLALGVALSGGAPHRLAKGATQKPGELTFAGDACNAYNARCAFGDPSSQKIVYLVGDSHALNLVHGLDELFKRRGYRGVALYDHGCLFLYETRAFQRGAPDRTCEKNIAAAYRVLASDRRPVIFAGDYLGYEQGIGPHDGAAFKGTGADYVDWIGKRLDDSLHRLRPSERPTIVVKQSYRLGLDLPNCLARPNANAESCAPHSGEEARRRSAAVDDMIDAAAERHPAMTLLDPKIVFCPTNDCIVRDGATLYFRDDAHLTNEGSRFLLRALEDDLMKAIEAASPRG